MNINYGLHKNFVAQLNKVREKYGESLMELNGIGLKQLGYTDFINNFIKTKTTAADISIDANSNVSVMDMSTMLKEMFKPQEKLLSLNKIYLEMIEDWGLIDTNNWIEQELIGGLYLHDGYEASFVPYCYNYSMKDLVEKGMVFDEILKAESPKHLDSFNQHVLEFVGYATNRQSGSVGLGDYLVWSYYFWYKDKKNQYMGITDFEIYKNQQFQMFVYALNQSWAKNNQSAFSNVSLFDRNYLISLFAEEKFPDGTDIIDHVEEIVSYQKDFLNWLKIERSKKLLTFPILSAALLYQEEKFIDEDFARFISDHIFVWKDISIMSENDITSMSSCCRLKSSTKTLGLFNSVAGSNLSIGSIKVSTINMNRIALDSNGDKEKFLDILRLRTELNLKMLKTHRKIISKNIEKGLLPIYTNGLMKLANQYSTFGIASFGDMMETLGLLKIDVFDNYYYDDEAYEFGETVFKIIDETIENFKFDFMINKEQIPAEGMAVTVLKKDKIFYPNKINTNLYSNQWLSLSKQSSMIEKIKSASIFDKYCSGGSMLFINVEGQFNNKEQTWELINLIAKNNVVTFNIVTKINICENEHNYTEISDICPICGEAKKDEATRIVGYYTRRSKWQKERKEEERKWFNFKD